MTDMLDAGALTCCSEFEVVGLRARWMIYDDTAKIYGVLCFVMFSCVGDLVSLVVLLAWVSCWSYLWLV